MRTSIEEEQRTVATLDPSTERLKDGRRTPPGVEGRLFEHVERLEQEHPPIPLSSIDYSMIRPDVLAHRFGPVLRYMSRVELEVERNVLELNQLLPDPPEVDRYFYQDVWLPQETQHGLILDQLQQLIGLAASTPDLSSVSFRLRLLGALGKVSAIQEVSRMLYYLTGMATERSAVLAYTNLHAGMIELGEKAIAATVVAPIRRQEPGHFAYYQVAASGLWAELAPWQRWLVRTARRRSFAPVGVRNARQREEFGSAILALGISRGDDADLARYAQQISRIEAELLWANHQGLRVPDYVLEALRRAVRSAQDASS